MNRLTKRTVSGTANIDFSNCCFEDGSRDKIAESAKRQLAIERLAAIEDILGDEYDLDRLETIISQRMTMREEVAEKMKLVGNISVDRLKEIVEAYKNGMYVLLPCKVGDTVWRVYDRCEFNGDCCYYTKQKCNGCEYRNVFAEEHGFWFHMLSQNGKLEHPYYTSKKAAEKAVVELKGKNNENY